MKKKKKFTTKATNAIDPASPSPFKGVPGKFGKSTNFQIPEWMFQRELEEYLAEQAKKKSIS